MSQKQMARLKSQVKMSPDGSTSSASLHKTQFENHLQSLIDDYQPGLSGKATSSLGSERHTNSMAAAYHNHLDDQMNPFQAPQPQQYQIHGTGATKANLMEA